MHTGTCGIRVSHVLTVRMYPHRGHIAVNGATRATRRISPSSGGKSRLGTGRSGRDCSEMAAAGDGMERNAQRNADGGYSSRIDGPVTISLPAGLCCCLSMTTWSSPAVSVSSGSSTQATAPTTLSLVVPPPAQECINVKLTQGYMRQVASPTHRGRHEMCTTGPGDGRPGAAPRNFEARNQTRGDSPGISVNFFHARPTLPLRLTRGVCVERSRKVPGFSAFSSHQQVWLRDGVDRGIPSANCEPERRRASSSWGNHGHQAMAPMFRF